MEIASVLLAMSLVCVFFYFSKRKKGAVVEKKTQMPEIKVEFKGLTSDDYKRLNKLHQRSKKRRDEFKKGEKSDS